MNIFSLDSVCIKCGNEEASSKFEPKFPEHLSKQLVTKSIHPNVEMIMRTCTRCGFSWREAPLNLDSPIKPAYNDWHLKTPLRLELEELRRNLEYHLQNCDDPKCQEDIKKQLASEANEYGELPGDICCQRATGKTCHEHTPPTDCDHEFKSYLDGKPRKCAKCGERERDGCRHCRDGLVLNEAKQLDVAIMGNEFRMLDLTSDEYYVCIIHYCPFCQAKLEGK